MLCQYAYFTTIQYSNAGTATVLQYTGPAMILVWLCIREQRKPKLYELVALVCAMTGTFILATHGNLEQLSIPAKALAWGMAAAMALVVYTLQPGRLMKEYSTLLTLGWGMFLGGGVLAAVCKTVDGPSGHRRSDGTFHGSYHSAGNDWRILALFKRCSDGGRVQCQYAGQHRAGGSNGDFCCMAEGTVPDHRLYWIYICTFHGIYYFNQ